jgi:hypothetical protein
MLSDSDWSVRNRWAMCVLEADDKSEGATFEIERFGLAEKNSVNCCVTEEEFCGVSSDSDGWLPVDEGSMFGRSFMFEMVEMEFEFDE